MLCGSRTLQLYLDKALCPIPPLRLQQAGHETHDRGESDSVSELEDEADDDDDGDFLPEAPDAVPLSMTRAEWILSFAPAIEADEMFRTVVMGSGGWSLRHHWWPTTRPCQSPSASRHF